MNKKLIIFDMDGTIYLGKNLLPGVLSTFKYLKERNINYVFFTNNSSHDLDFYYKKVSNFGIECTLDDNFYSSSEVTISYLLDNNYKDIYVVANKSFKDKLAKHFNLISSFDKERKIDAVVAGFTTELVYQELKDACLYLETRDIPLFATNLDFRCPIEDGLYIPDCGGMCEWIYFCTGKKARVFGKPEPTFIYYLAKKYNVSLEEILVVGDRLYTDILSGINAKVDTLCVLSGESSLEDINNYPHKPTFVLPSIKDLPDLLNK